MTKFLLKYSMLTTAFALLSIAPTASLSQPVPGKTGTSITIFSENSIHFTPDGESRFDSGRVRGRDNGRIAETEIKLPHYDSPVRITAFLKIKPIPKDEQFVFDKWDRAGNIRIVSKDGSDIEIVKFITSYGGVTEHEIDVSHLAGILRGRKTIAAFIDTWVTPAWKIDFSLTYTPDSNSNNPSWIKEIAYEQSFDSKLADDGGIETTVIVPEGLSRVVLNYLVSGHCTDGTDADEFVSKDNVIYIDGRVVFRYKPWRDDCRQYRDINPYCRRWSDGSWSSDYSRSGWCPGDIVEPMALDLSDHLSAGEHTIRISIENIRPRNDNGHYGYWRISSHLLGW